MMPYLGISGNQIVDGDGRPVVLRGFGLGGWLKMENSITGCPADEEAQRQSFGGAARRFQAHAWAAWRG